ncbi:MAG: hypothetical protein ACK6DA_09755 [Candidatus Kapaibacterium sp.]|jgi:hypothetical protein
MIKVNCSIHWCHHSKPGSMSNKYEVTLGGLSESAVAALKEVGIVALDKTDKGMGWCIAPKSNIPLPVFDEAGESLEGAIVGNGSRGVAIVTPYEWEYKNRSGISPNLARLIVTDLIQYSTAADIASNPDVPAL